MGSYALKEHCVFFELVDQQPITSKVALQPASIVSDQLVIAKFRR